MAKRKGLAVRFKGAARVGVGGVYCYCCNNYKGKDKPKLGRSVRRVAKQDLRQDSGEV